MTVRRYLLVMWAYLEEVIFLNRGNSGNYKMKLMNRMSATKILSLKINNHLMLR